MPTIRILYNAPCGGVCALLMCVLLSISAPGQSPVAEPLGTINKELPEGTEDTARVHMLLSLSSQATAHVDRRTARDSALQFARVALALSAKMGYDSGVYRSYLREMGVWAQVHNRAYYDFQDETVALANARAVQNKLLAFVQRGGTNDHLGQVYSDMADLYSIRGDPAEAVLLYDSAAACFRRSGNVLRESRALYQLGLHYNEFGKDMEALPRYHRSIKLAESIGASGVYSTYGLLGRTYRVLGSYTLALKYHVKALQLAEAAGDTTAEMGAIHLFLGLTYAGLQNYPLAREHYEKAYRIQRFYTQHHSGEFFSAAMNLAGAIARENPQHAVEFLTQFKKEHEALITRNRATEISYEYLNAYSQLQDYATAERYLNDALSEFENKMPGEFEYLRIAKFLVRLGKYRASEKYLEECERLSKPARRLPYLKSIYSLWYKVDSAKGDLVGALEKFKLYKAYTDSMLNDSKAKEIALLEVEYETQKKEQSIALLTKDSELSRRQVAQVRFQKNGILAGLTVAVAILGLLFNQYRVKKKNNVELTRQQHEIQSTNEALQKTILEKEWLLKEVHHRVKNNLQTVVSLLQSQSYVLQNSEAVSAIHDSQNRVHAMSLIHQKLYLTDHRTSINMSGYLSELTEYLRDSFSTGRLIQFQLSLQPIELDVSQAIPIGLILNEAITNAIKYAFPVEPYENSRVVISMQHDEARNVTVTIADNGRGLPPDLDSSTSRTGMGFKLMYGLTSEIDGCCKISSNINKGVSIEITFKASALLE